MNVRRALGSARGIQRWIYRNSQRRGVLGNPRRWLSPAQEQICGSASRAWPSLARTAPALDSGTLPDFVTTVLKAACVLEARMKTYQTIRNQAVFRMTNLLQQPGLSSRASPFMPGSFFLLNVWPLDVSIPPVAQMCPWQIHPPCFRMCCDCRLPRHI